MQVLDLSKLTSEDQERLEQFNKILAIGFERYLKEKFLKKTKPKGG